MNRKQRRQFSAAHIRYTNRIEARYVPAIAAALKKQVRLFIAVLKARGPRAAEISLNSQVYNTDITRILERLHGQVIMETGLRAYRSLTRAAKQVKKESAGFGFSQAWNDAITTFLQQLLLVKAVVPVTETTKRQILAVLEQGQVQGWGIERMVTELENLDVIMGYRARRIVRTELGMAANFGNNLAAEEVEFEVDKEWITANDHRVRDSHRKMDGQLLDTDLPFEVPIYKGKTLIGSENMTGPGDPQATAGNVINCRCTIALVPRRDENGDLVMKQGGMINKITGQPIIKRAA